MNTIQRYRDEYSGCEPDQDGEYIRYEDLVKLKKELLEKIDVLYMDIYDSDNYVTGKLDVEDKVVTMFRLAGVE